MKNVFCILLAIAYLVSAGCADNTVKSNDLGMTSSPVVINDELIIPPYGARSRHLWVWDYYLVKTTALADELKDFCQTFGINMVLLNSILFIGKHPDPQIGERWTTAHVNSLRYLISTLKSTGIKVYALDGDSCDAIDQSDTYQRVVDRVVAYNQIVTGSEQFDGMVFDIEWWVCGEESDEADYVPPLIDMMKDVRRMLNRPVGLFQTWWTVVGGDDVYYDGATLKAGQHLVNNIDMLFVYAYDNDYVDQIGYLDDWVAYADSSSNRPAIHGISNVKSTSSAGTTYWQESYSDMEESHEAIQDYFVNDADCQNSSFRGMGIHFYEDYAIWLEDQSLWDASFYTP